MSDLRSPAYWVSHTLSVAATIIGVYYAAIVGFDAALKLELVKADRGTYYLSESLYQELDFNVKNMDRYIEQAKGKKFVYQEHLDGIKLNDYVFQASKFSESTFEIEPRLLSEISTYYFSVGNAIAQYYQGHKQSPNNVMVVLKRESKRLQEQQTLERFAAYKDALARDVKDSGVDVEHVSFK
ncbi:hypothetical protein [uncultured Pseudoteredinibacter sp.]|uniref:hypothetical protein n=1 Tax=uncultured Pseudoteredinibacter sp. TaxID=1641701 RepID=UPI002627E4AA|nr:hypothetical protein [uncultured Pseudoteredinibacter sp.]